MIPYGRQEITEADIDAVVEVLRSDFLTQGPMVPRFEQTVLDAVGGCHAIAVNSATSALHMACLALGLGAGDRLWTTPVSFVASSNCALYCGADVDFVDIDPETRNLSLSELARKLALAEQEGHLPKVLVVVHLCGFPCDMESVADLAARYGVKVIEDASHAIGASYSNGERVGSGRWSDITVFSFHPVKIVTTGEGGMALTRHSELAARLSLLRSHGITRDESLMLNASEGPWYYEQLILGFNYRMTDLQAALGISQMERLTSYVERRRVLARRYCSLLAGFPLVLPKECELTVSAFHLYVVELQLEVLTQSHREIFEALRAKEIGVNLHYIPIYRQPYYATMGFKAEDFPAAENYYRTAISLPLYPSMTEAQQDKVVQALREVLV